LKMKVRALPTCRKPVGDGANRTRMGVAEDEDSWVIAEKFSFDATSQGYANDRAQE
jgi:hypothetical protein